MNHQKIALQHLSKSVEHQKKAMDHLEMFGSVVVTKKLGNKLKNKPNKLPLKRK